MNQHQRELRRAAAQAFMRSLDKLHETLGEPISDPEKTDFTPDAFEQAVADIEQFMQTQPDASGVAQSPNHSQH